MWYWVGYLYKERVNGWVEWSEVDMDRDEVLFVWDE